MSQIEESIEGAGSSEQAASPQHLQEVEQAAQPSQHDAPSHRLIDVPPFIGLGLSDTNQRTTVPSFNSDTHNSEPQ